MNECLDLIYQWVKQNYEEREKFQTLILKELKKMSAEFDALKTKVEAVLAENKTLKDAARADKAALADASADKQGMAALTTEVTNALTPAT